MFRWTILTCCFIYGCSKKPGISQIVTEKATIVFWTSNAPRLTSCSPVGIMIHVFSPGLNGPVEVGLVTLTSINATEPVGCNNQSIQVDIIPAGPIYTYRADGCNGNPSTTGSIDFLHGGECRKISIP